MVAALVWKEVALVVVKAKKCVLNKLSRPPIELYIPSRTKKGKKGHPSRQLSLITA